MTENGEIRRITDTPARRRHGEAKSIVLEWLTGKEPGEEFHYLDVVQERGLNGVTASGIMRSMMRESPPQLLPGSYAGWYKKPVPLPAAPVQQQAAPAPRVVQQQAAELMEVVGTFRDGSKLLRDENGALWEAQAK
jgi:hypothetical protein